MDKDRDRADTSSDNMARPSISRPIGRGPRAYKRGRSLPLATIHVSLSNGGLPDLDLRAVQLLLSYHGFNPGPIDGAEGERTRAAIAAFTARHELSGISENHRGLLTALRELLPTAPNEQLGVLPPTPGPVPAAPELRLVQSTLAFLRFDPGTVDGKPGPRTRSAIRDFQRSCGAMPTGEVDAGLVASLKAETRTAFGHNRIADIRRFSSCSERGALTRAASMASPDQGPRQRSRHSTRLRVRHLRLKWM